jgi:hypothetical protein
MGVIAGCMHHIVAAPVDIDLGVEQREGASFSVEGGMLRRQEVFC